MLPMRMILKYTELTEEKLPNKKYVDLFFWMKAKNSSKKTMAI